jgi:hypothetical protein
MVDFDSCFEVMPGTRAKEAEVTPYLEPDPYEAVPRRTITE